VEYYRTPEGKFKKKLQNGKRSGNGTRAVLNDSTKAGMNLVVQEHRIGASMVCYLRMVISLIERRRVSAAEILEMLKKVLRQHSLSRRSRIDYIVQYLNKHAP
jgi:hypothetical protein